MNSDEIGGLVDKVAEKLGVASQEVLAASEVLVAEYRRAQLVGAACSILAFCAVVVIAFLVYHTGVEASAGVRDPYYSRHAWNCQDWNLLFWVLLFLTAIPCGIAFCVYVYQAAMPRVALLRDLLRRA